MGGKHTDDLCQRLREHLRSCGLRVGDQIPGEREISAALGVGRTALRPCLNALEDEGVIERRPQSGTYLLSLPSPHARGATIALIAPFQGNQHTGHETDAAWLYRVISAFERVAVPAGARLILKDQSPTAHDPCSIKDLVREVIAEGVQAAVLIHASGPKEKVSYALGLLHDAGIHPIVVSSRSFPGLTNRVYFDSGWGAYLATRHLLQKGHQRIGFAGARGGHPWMRERYQGYRDALDTAEIVPDEGLTYLPGDPSDERQPTRADGAEALDYFLALPAEQQPTALIAANDTIALGILEAARAKGVAIPESLSLIGFDNDPGALLAGLTTVERPTEALGEAVARTTLERIAAGADTATITQHLRPRLIERKTVSYPKSPEANENSEGA